jgi:hypothetical protein
LIIADLTNKVTDMKPQIPTLLLTVAALGWLIYVSVLRNARAADPALPDDIRSRAAALLEERKRLDQTIWKDEVLAQEYEQVFVNLWDALRAADDKLKVVEEFAFPRLVLGQPEAPQSKDLGITVTGFGGPGKTLDRAAWQRLLTQYREDGIEIVQTEWHHAAFDPANPQAVRSTVNMTMHLLNRRTHTRTIIKGPPKVVWEPRPNASELAQVQTIDATDITIYARQGEPTFRRAYAIQPSARSQGNADPLLLPFHIYDLNKDGLSEIIIPSLNSVRVNKGNREFESFSLFKYPLRNRSLVGVFTDFTGDGWADFLCAGAGPLALFVADAAGRFSLPPRQAASDAVAFDNASVFTAGDDLDGDGRMDLIVYRHSIGTEYPFEIYALENRLETDRHWIGLRLQAGAGGSVMGATVVLRTAAGKQIAKVVSGDSYYCQHAPVLHFGLGAQTSVESIEVIWINGSRQQLDAPAIDRYDTASAAK